MRGPKGGPRVVCSAMAVILWGQHYPRADHGGVRSHLLQHWWDGSSQGDELQKTLQNLFFFPPLRGL